MLPQLQGCRHPSNVSEYSNGILLRDLSVYKCHKLRSFIAYPRAVVAFMPLSVWLGKHVGYHRWIPTLMIGWGTFTIAHAFIKNQAQLYAFRLMIGVFGAGYYPSVAYYFASCYIRFDFALRIATFYVSQHRPCHRSPC